MPTTDAPTPSILVAGASVRAAATSIRRAGFRPIAVDLFADLDLAETTETYRIDPSDYPGGIAARVAHLPPIPWMYTGALENHPDVVAALSRQFRLCGVSPDALRAVRDPFQLAEVARAAGCPMPETRCDPAGLPTDGSWLIKPVASGGGLGIRPWLGGEPPGPASAFVWQRRVVGEGRPLESFAAIFLGDDSGARLVGVTRQRVSRFRYVGSLGPVPIPEPTRVALDALGHALVGAFGLRGVFGVDFVVGGGRPWVVEVNPRYTASVEVLELALGRSIVAEHLACFKVASPGGNPPGPLIINPVVAKSIWFASASGTLVKPIPATIPRIAFSGRWAVPPGPVTPGGTAGLWDVPDVADLPQVGTRFEPGDPIMTVFAGGSSVGGCFYYEMRRWRPWRAWLYGSLARSESQPGAIKPEC